jgi:kynurenine 3-monooxygenase
MSEITIIGAGLVGSLQALYAAQAGFTVDVFERRPDIRLATLYQGRSINLALSDRGWKALQEVGLAEQVHEIAIPMYKRTMHDVSGPLRYQPYGSDGQAIYSVSRGALNRLLLEAADRTGKVRMHFEWRCSSVDFKQKELYFDAANSGQRTVKYGRLIGTDGAFSAIRQALMMNDRFDYHQFYIEHGYKELTIMPDEKGGFRMEKETLHIWPRKDFMLIALPNPGGSFTCTLFFQMEGPLSFASLDSDEKVMDFFNSTFPDIVPLIPDLAQQWTTNPASALVTIRCKPWNYRDEVLILGDAAHALVPFYGQGMNAGFEDCSLLNAALKSQGGDFSGLFSSYAANRQPDGVAISELALRNFIEMRDKTADPSFLLQKKIEARFSAAHPEKWQPLYSMVTFSHRPYSEALRRGELQDSIMKQVMNRPDIEQVWDAPEIESAILAAWESSPELH